MPVEMLLSRLVELIVGIAVYSDANEPVPVLRCSSSFPQATFTCNNGSAAQLSVNGACEFPSVGNCGVFASANSTCVVLANCARQHSSQV